MEQRSRFRANFNRAKPSDAGQSTPVHTPGADVVSPPGATNQPAGSDKSPKSKKVGFFFGRKWLLVVIAIVVVAFGAITYKYIDTKNQLNTAKNPETAGKTEAEKITNQIKSAIELPTGETPTLATVNDVSKLKAQAFFKNAQNGDKVLVYTKAGVAVLYRPTTKKVIIYSFVNAGDNQQQQQ